MVTPQQPIIVKTYADERLNEPIRASCVSHKHLAAMPKNDQDFMVREAKTGAGTVRLILEQIIPGHASHG